MALHPLVAEIVPREHRTRASSQLPATDYIGAMWRSKELESSPFILLLQNTHTQDIRVIHHWCANDQGTTQTYVSYPIGAYSRMLTGWSDSLHGSHPVPTKWYWIVTTRAPVAFSLSNKP